MTGTEFQIEVTKVSRSLAAAPPIMNPAAILRASPVTFAAWLKANAKQTRAK
jgi:hypothetical protein